MDTKEIKDLIVKRGIKNLKEFGYPNVTKKNIFTDEIYSKMFLSMLQDNLGRGFDTEINELINKCGK